jgi:hypothetical protein
MLGPFVTDFDDWLVGTFARVGAFTMLIVLVEIGETSVAPLRSSYLHVVGDETRWPEISALLDASGEIWNGVVFFQADRAGLVMDAVAKQRLAALTRRLHEDRSLIREGEFFNTHGLRLTIQEIASR